MRVRLALVILAFALPASAIDFNQARVYVTGGKSVTTWHGQVDVHAVNLEMATKLSPRTELAIVVAPTAVWQPRSWFGYQYGNGNEKVWAVSTSLLARRLFNADSPNIHFYAEAATGPLWGQKMIPAATSHLNFITQFGAGVVLHPQSRYPILAGYRYQHISNGGTSSRNPGLNVSALMVGVKFGR